MSEPQVANAPIDQAIADALIIKIEQLEQAILTAHPSLPILLKTIHKTLADDPAIVTLLSEEQIGKITNGLKLHTKTELITASLKKTTAKPLKATTVDDI